MLGKLMKHEWKSTYKIAGSMLLFLIILGLLTGLSFLTPSWRTTVSDNHTGGFHFSDLLVITLLIIFFVSIVAVSVGMVIYLAVHFFKGMYSEEGYLTHTLPANAHELLGSRIIIGSLWTFLYGVAVALSIGIVGLMLGNAVVNGSGMSPAVFWGMVMGQMKEIDEGFREGMGMGLVTYGLIYVLIFLVGSITSVCYLYGAATLGQLSAKHKVLMSIASYFGIMVLNQILTSMLIFPLSLRNAVVSDMTLYSDQAGEAVMNPANYMLGTILSSLGMNVLIAVVLYFISVYIIKNKLNLE